ncbi:unnamed protein product [Allacma fusca]|uniref:Uncharacterized protein n=1 Tax=Allacma fusca TaxID=39272 RepID=A0A8J2LL74_9HEXA|nr:unnamed protein product [Allacma fusca]
MALLCASASGSIFSNLQPTFDGAQRRQGSSYPFQYEGQTPQRITTGCQGVKYDSGDADIEYYFVDATGKKKIISPGASLDVAFPGPSIFPGVYKHFTVYYHEFCFPLECSSNTCGYVVGPVTSVGE